MNRRAATLITRFLGTAAAAMPFCLVALFVSGVLHTGITIHTLGSQLVLAPFIVLSLWFIVVAWRCWFRLSSETVRDASAAAGIEIYCALMLIISALFRAAVPLPITLIVAGLLGALVWLAFSLLSARLRAVLFNDLSWELPVE